MKKFLILALSAVVFCFPAIAQNESAGTSSNVNPERLTQQQSRYIISNLGLTGNTATQFADLYAAYKEEMMAVKDCYPMHRRHHAYDSHHNNHHSDYRSSHHYDHHDVDDCRPEDCAPQEFQGLTDEQIEANILNRFAQARKMLDIREKYYKAFREFLTPGQIQAMYGAERRCAERFVQNAENCKPNYRHHR